MATIFTVAAWEVNIHIIFKILFTIVSGATIILSFVNQYQTFKKNNGHSRWVAILEGAVLFMVPKWKRNKLKNKSGGRI